MKKVAITGGLACGKSSVCHFLEELGAFIVSADSIVHQLLSQDPTIQQAVVKLLGSQVTVEGQIDRAQVAKQVFENPDLLQRLEQVIHPAVRHEIERLYAEVEQQAKAVLFGVEIPLLFEGETESEYDATVAVIADEAACRKRYGKNDFNQRQQRQLPVAEKARRADYVITNDATLEELKAQTTQVFRALTSQDKQLFGK